MDSAFRQNVAGATVVQLGLELGCLVGAVLLALSYHGPLAPHDAFGPALVFAVVMVCLNGAVGLYQRDRGLPFGEYLLRRFLALLMGFALAYLSARALPGGAFFQQALASTFLIALCGLVLLRQCVLTRATRMLVPHRVLVLGTGPEARIVDASLSVAKIPGLQLVGFYPLDKMSDRSIVAGL